MTVTVLIPTPLQKFSQDQASLDLEAKNIQELIEALEQACPGMKERICDKEGKLRRFLNFYVNGDDIRFLEGQTTPLPDGAEVSIVPAVAGG